MGPPHSGQHLLGAGGDPAGLAADQGWFDAEFAADGVVVRSLQDGAAPLRAEHFSHGLTSLIREGGNVPALWARSRGADTRLVVQGITGREAVNLTREGLDYGTKIVGGVTPGRAGRDVYGVHHAW